MRRHLAFVAVLSLVAVACEEKPANPAPKSGTAPAGGVGDMAAQAKEKAVAAADAVVKEANATLDLLKAKGSAIAADAKPAFDKAVADINTMIQDVSAKASSLKTATGEQAAQLSQDVTTTAGKLTQAVKDAAAKYLK